MSIFYKVQEIYWPYDGDNNGYKRANNVTYINSSLVQFISLDKKGVDGKDETVFNIILQGNHITCVSSQLEEIFKYEDNSK